ncbi:hypothetical protein [Nocardioides currus]|nr:hypothetical protein [Nocardioides currus]
MSSSIARRVAVGVALATGAVTFVACPASAQDPTPVAPAAREGSVGLTGRLLVVAGEAGEPDTYAVRRGDGRVVAIDAGSVGAFDHDVATGDRFTGSVRLPVVDGRATTMRAAADARTPLTVTSATIRPRPTSSGPVSHRVAVAITTNLGSYGRNTAQIMAQLKSAGDYWVDQADGKITGFQLPASFVSYTTTKTTVANGCGIGGTQTTAPDFAAVTAEAATLFPGYDFVTGTDQLVVLMPDVCAQMYDGRASTGESLVSGGVSIVSSSAGMADTMAHEWGHNYGLAHANTATEYGDIYEVMGSAPNSVPPELGTGYRQEQGLIQAGEVATLTGVSGSASIRDRANAPETGVRGVEVVDPDNGLTTWFDLRNGTAGDAGAGYRNGITAYGQAYRASGIVVEQDADRGLRLLLTGGNTALVAGEAWSNGSGSMKVTVSALNAAAGTATLTSTYAPGPALTGGVVGISGTYRPFERLTATPTSFSPTPAGLRYQWLANGTPIAGAESSTFDVPLSLAGAALAVRVTAYAPGRAPTPVQSAPVTVAPATFYVATGTATRPVVSGTLKTGSTLSATSLSWVGADGLAPAGLTSTFEWYRGTTIIPGATGSTYTLKGADLDQYIGVRNVAAAPGFEVARASVSATSRVTKGKLPSSKPKIKFKGKKAKAGTKLKAKPGAWVKGAKFRYTWYAGKRVIKGATRKSFVVPRSLRGAKVSVKVRGTAKGYKATSRRSGKVRIR